MGGESGAICTGVFAADPRLADRMWASDDDSFDAAARRRGRALCDACPLQAECLAASLTNRRKDAMIVGGLTWRERRRLAHLVGDGLGADPRRLGRLHANRVSEWIMTNPDAVTEARDDMRAYWRRTKDASDMRLFRRTGHGRDKPGRKPDGTPAMAVQGTLF
jgi:hypothetical protein